MSDETKREMPKAGPAPEFPPSWEREIPIGKPSHASDADAKRGLYGKYIVERRDGSGHPGGKHGRCDYFVLDLVHDAHAPAALRAYADSCTVDYPQLAADLRVRFSGERDGTSDRREGGSEGSRGVDRPEEVAGCDDASSGRRGGADGAVRGAVGAGEAGRPEHGSGDAERAGGARVLDRPAQGLNCVDCGAWPSVRVFRNGSGPRCFRCDMRQSVTDEDRMLGQDLRSALGDPPSHPTEGPFWTDIVATLRIGGFVVQRATLRTSVESQEKTR